MRARKRFDKVTRLCYKKGVKTVTFYAFSTENWRRPAEEVAALTNILTEYLKKMIGYFERRFGQIYTHAEDLSATQKSSILFSET